VQLPKGAEQKYAENLLVIDGHADLVARYTANRKSHERHAVPYERALKQAQGRTFVSYHPQRGIANADD
jgi:hypothetical protein